MVLDENRPVAGGPCFRPLIGPYGGVEGISERPINVPTDPARIYKDQGWAGMEEMTVCCSNS